MRKSTVVWTMLLVLLLSVSAFAQDRLVVWVGGHVVEQEDTWNKIIKDFSAATGIDVEYRLIGFDVYYDTLVTAFSAGRGPDVTFADLGGWAPTFAAQGWIESLEDRLATADETEQIWPNLWPTVTYQGERYGLPWYTDCRVLMYNKIMFEEAGLDPDVPPVTWDELLEYAKILTDPAKMQYGYGVSGKRSEVATLGYMIFLHGAGGELLTEDYSKAAFNTPEGLSALKFYTELHTTHKVSPPATPSYGEDDFRSMMAQNRVAMAISGPWAFPLIEMANPDIKGNYAVAIHPYSAEPASVLGGWASVVSSSSTKKEEAWKFIDYITSYDVWRMWLERHGGPMPSRMDVSFDAPEFDDPKWEVILEAFPYAKVRPPVPEWPEISDRIQNMVQNVITGQVSAEDAIAEAEKEINTILGH